MRYNNKSIIAIIIATFAIITFNSCDKVDPMGVLMGSSSINDRVKAAVMYDSLLHSDVELDSCIDLSRYDSYSFLVGSDSHTLHDTGRLEEMWKLQINDPTSLFSAHLGDIVETQPEYYKTVGDVFKKYKQDYEGSFAFFPVVGNHDITRNGWSLYHSVFGPSTYSFRVIYPGTKDGLKVADKFIFLDSASGTMGDYQLELIANNFAADDIDEQFTYNNVFVFTHTNIFRPSGDEFASTFPREELYFLLKKFAEWQCRIVFCGHVHKWDQRWYGGVEYLTLDAMGERNSPDPGDYLVKVTVNAKTGEAKWEKVHMSYVAPKE